MVIEKVMRVFEECQDGTACHNKLCDVLADVFYQSEFDVFWKDFLCYLKHTFEYLTTREPAVENIVDFAVKFVTHMVKLDNEKEGDDVGNEEEETGPGAKLLNKLFTFLLKHHNYEDSVRFRCCQIINKVLCNLGVDAELDGDMYEQMHEVMLQRLRDVLPVVQEQAIYASSRFQDPQDNECPVIEALLLTMSEQKAFVRKAALRTIAMSRKTVPYIIKRTRDENDDVRKHAYLVIADKIHIKALLVSDRVKVLQCGLNDRVESVKNACTTKLLPAWLSTYGGNILDLLEKLDVETYPDVCKQMLTVVLKEAPLADLVREFVLLNEQGVIDIAALTAPKSFYWFHLCQYLHSLRPAADDQFDALMPDCRVFCAYILQYVEVMKETYTRIKAATPTATPIATATQTDAQTPAQTPAQTGPSEEDLILQMLQNFICEQFLRLTALYELSDLAICDQLKTVYHTLLTEDCIEYSLIEHLMVRVIPLRRDAIPLIAYAAETISAIREPIIIQDTSLDDEEKRQIQMKVAGIRVEINQTREDIEAAVAQQDFMTADTLQKKVEELEKNREEMVESMKSQPQEVRTERSDPYTILKCLHIIKELLIHVDLTHIDPTLRTISDTLILPNILRSEMVIRDVSLNCLGLLCLIDREFTLQYLVLLIEVTQVDHDRVRVTALKLLFDIFQLYGMDIVVEATTDTSQTQEPNEDEENEDSEEKKKQSEAAQTTTSNIIYILVTMLDSDNNSEIRTVVAEGLAKLMIAGRLSCPKLASRLLLQWYNPMSEDDLRMRQVLALFFPLFARAGQEYQQVIQEAYLLTLKTLLDAPSSSPLSSIDIDAVSYYCLDLTNASLLAEKEKDVHSDVVQEHTVHNDLAMSLCNLILSSPDSVNVRIIAKALNFLELNPGFPHHINDIHTLSTNILEVVKDKKSIVMLKKFEANVTYLLKSQQLAENATTNDETIADTDNPDAEESEVFEAEKDDTLPTDETETETNPADLYRTILEEANKSGSVSSFNRSSNKSMNSLSSLSAVEEGPKEPSDDGLSEKLAENLSISQTSP